MKQYLLMIEHAELIYKKEFSLSQEYTENELIELVKSSFIADYVEDLDEYSGDTAINIKIPILIDLYEKQKDEKYDLIWSASFYSFDVLCDFVNKMSVDEQMAERIEKAKDFISNNYRSIEEATESGWRMWYVQAVMSSLIGNSIIRFIDNYSAIYNAYCTLGDEFSKKLCYDYENKLKRAFK